MIIGFYTPRLDVRGSCEALYQYAKHSEEIYSNTSIIFVPEEITPQNECEGIKKFTKRFKVVIYDNLEKSLIENNCDILYTIKYGKNDGILSVNIPTIVHCVFSMEQPHGDLYIAVSEALANKYKSNRYLPHMVGMTPILHKRNLRKRLKIPENAIVIGRHGGMDTFNLEFVRGCIAQIVSSTDNIYFLFMNTPVFFHSPKIIHLDRNSDLDFKEEFINSCDAGIEASTLGHTFGLSCAEFSVNNKPMLIYNGNVWNNAHIKIMGDKGIYFKTKEDLLFLIQIISGKKYDKKDLNAYRDFTAEKIAGEFQTYCKRLIE